MTAIKSDSNKTVEICFHAYFLYLAQDHRHQPNIHTREILPILFGFAQFEFTDLPIVYIISSFFVVVVELKNIFGSLVDPPYRIVRNVCQFEIGNNNQR